METDAGQLERTGAAIEAQFQFIGWLVRAFEKFPRSQKPTIGDRIAPTNAESRDRQLSDTGGRELQFCRGTGHQPHLLDACSGVILCLRLSLSRCSPSLR